MKYIFTIITDNNIIVIENNNGRLKLKYNNIIYGSGKHFIKDITGVELPEEPDYDTIIDILKNMNN